MHLGWSEPSTLVSKLCRDYTPAQRSVVEHLRKQVDYFQKDGKPLPGSTGIVCSRTRRWTTTRTSRACAGIRA